MDLKILPKEIEKIIINYVYQLIHSEKYNSVMMDVKFLVYHHIFSPTFSLLEYNGFVRHYYWSERSKLLILSNKRGRNGVFIDTRVIFYE